MQKPSENSPQPESKWLTTNDFEFLCFNLVREFMTYNEPIPEYVTHDDLLLQSALGSPSQTFDEKFLYPTIVEQGAILFYSLIKNHPFKNGNKRVAVMALLAFLSLNDKWLSIPPLVLYQLACDVSGSKSTIKDKILISIQKILTKFIVPFPKKEK